jgi:DNA polymerase III epsilon subunit-like protein
MYLVFDTETTGLPASFSAPLTDSDNWPRLVELAWGVYGEDGQQLSNGQLLVRPENFAIPSEAVSIHGITTEQATAHGVELREALEKLDVAASECQYVAAHNLEYDLAIVGAELHRLGRPVFGADKQLVCTMRMGSNLEEGKRSKPPKLQELHAKLFGEEMTGAHRAEADVAACARCLFALLQRGMALQAPNAPVQSATPQPKPALPAFDLDNREFQVALDLIENTNRSVFLTGKAGTGKSTFLRHIVANTRKKAIVVAPTGVAALNAGGMTIHKMFSLPLSILQPNDHRVPYFGPQRYTGECLNKAKYDLLQAVELVIIDEVSMVRADILDAVDRALRLNSRRLREPFGGKQVLLVGDAYQLPPVLIPADRQLYERFYGTRYFFGARVFAQFPLITVELRKAYRQQDPHFIGLLDRVRTNQADGKDMGALNGRLTNAPRVAGRGITLSTRNKDAEDYNANELTKLTTPLVKFMAVVTGDFAESDFPTARELVLKCGAQVMFVRNDRSGRWVNGTIGKIVKLEKSIVEVETEQGVTYTVEAETWDKFTYGYDEATGRIESKVIGMFTQRPLKLAWALTVHKSQGLTFDAVEINAPGGFFDAGQLYVALSRCRSFEGLQLRTAVGPRDVRVSQEVVALHRNANDEQQIATALEEARPTKLYQRCVKLFNRGDLPGAVMAFCEALSLRNDAQKPVFGRLIRHKLQGLLKTKQQLTDLTAAHGKLVSATQAAAAEQAVRTAQEQGALALVRMELDTAKVQIHEAQKQHKAQHAQWQEEKQQLQQMLTSAELKGASESEKAARLQMELQQTVQAHLQQVNQLTDSDRLKTAEATKNAQKLQERLAQANALIVALRAEAAKKDSYNCNLEEELKRENSVITRLREDYKKCQALNAKLETDLRQEQLLNRPWWRKLTDSIKSTS